VGDDLEALRRRAADLNGLITDEVLEVNRAILAVEPSDGPATNRLGIALTKRGELEEALSAFERGIEANPGNAIARRRLEELDQEHATPTPGPSNAASRREPEDIVEPILAGPGRGACLRFFADSIREIQKLDAQRLAVTDIPSQNRFRVVGGILSACSVYRELLDVMIDRRGQQSLIDEVVAAGGQVIDATEGGAVPSSLQLGVPPVAVDRFRAMIWPAHREQLLASIEYGAPTHMNKHHPELMRYLLDQAARAEP